MAEQRAEFEKKYTERDEPLRQACAFEALAEYRRGLSLLSRCETCAARQRVPSAAAGQHELAPDSGGDHGRPHKEAREAVIRGLEQVERAEAPS